MSALFRRVIADVIAFAGMSDRRARTDPVSADSFIDPTERDFSCAPKHRENGRPPAGPRVTSLLAFGARGAAICSASRRQRAHASSRKRVYRILEIVPTIAQTCHYANNVAESCVHARMRARIILTLTEFEPAEFPGARDYARIAIESSPRSIITLSTYL